MKLPAILSVKLPVKLLLVLLSTLLVIACSGAEEGDEKSAKLAQPSMPPAAVAIVNPIVGEMNESISIAGSLAANQSALLSAEIAGRIEQVHIADGQQVEAGQLLFSIDSSMLDAQLKHAEATVKLRSVEKQRVESLIKQNVASQYDVDKAETQLLTAQADSDFALAQYNKAKIKAPFAGYLGIRKVNQGSYVELGTPLIQLTQLDPLLLDFHVPETALPTISVNEEVMVIIPSLYDLQIKATILAIEPSINTQTRSTLVRASIDNKEGSLRPGLFARINLPLKSLDEVLWLPESAIFYRGEDKLVMLNNNGTALRKVVHVVSYQDGKAAIASGLSINDEVIVSGHHKLPFDGMPVLVTNSSSANPQSSSSEPASVKAEEQ